MSHNPPMGPVGETGPAQLNIPDTEPMRILQECVEVMRKKANDYQNGNSNVKQADYYEHGIQSLYDMINTKRLRVKSLMDAAKHGVEPNHESLEDSLKDLINYASFAVAWIRGKIDGQDPKLDMFNHPRVMQFSSNTLVSNPSPTDVNIRWEPIGPDYSRAWGPIAVAQTTKPRVGLQVDPDTGYLE